MKISNFFTKICKSRLLVFLELPHPLGVVEGGEHP